MYWKAERRQHAHDAEHLREERIASEQRYAAAKRERDASEQKLHGVQAEMALLLDRSHGLLAHACASLSRAPCHVFCVAWPSMACMVGWTLSVQGQG